MSSTSRTALAVVLTFVALAASPVSSRAQEAAHPTDQGLITLADHGYLFVGGRYTAAENGDVMEGSMYVEHFKPAEVTRPFPVVMIHGGGQTGTNFTGTPDGRRGWAHDFLRAGYEV